MTPKSPKLLEKLGSCQFCWNEEHFGVELNKLGQLFLKVILSKCLQSQFFLRACSTAKVRLSVKDPVQCVLIARRWLLDKLNEL